ncbi:MAG: HemK2/MTQ2 family protein methyltransferase [Nanoarchaeota archaeon]
MGIYQPAEDSHLLQKYVRRYALGRVLDLGTGSGIQALTAMASPTTQFVLAVDSDDDAVHAFREKVQQERLRKIQVQLSDLFSNVQGQFNLIIFNPPYLPQDQGITDPTIYGGKKGWELSQKFFEQAAKYLYPDGKILFLFSSLTDQKKIDEILEKNLFAFQLLDQQKLAFEMLSVYCIEKSLQRRELEKKGVEDIHYFTHGKRGDIFTGIIDYNKFIKKYLPAQKNVVKVAIKVKRKESLARQRMENETRWLTVINKQGIGPRLLFSGEEYLVYEFVEGEYLLEWIKANSSNPTKIQHILQQILEQLFLLDQLGVNKEELHHPQKHILITKNNQPVLLDFERCHPAKKVQNVTQFAEFLYRVRGELGPPGALVSSSLRDLARAYKRQPTREQFHNLLKAIGIEAQSKW